MQFLTTDLCDNHPDVVRVVEPLFTNYGGKVCFGGEIVTVKCHEDNSVVKETAGTPGHGKVMVVDGGASMRRALLGDMIAENAVKNGWQGFIIYGCIRDVDAIHALDIGAQALGTIPLKTDKRGIGDRNVSVTFGGVTFHPGEFVYADNNGIVVSAEPLVT
jgi:regulator of ribonuclease activity A